MFESIILYVCADNDLSNFADKDLLELKSISIPQYMQVDQRCKGWGDKRPNSFRIARKSGSEEKIMLKKELDTGEVSSLKEFLSWVESHSVNFEKSLFIFWGHGQGWMGSCNDFKNQDRLDLLEIRDLMSNYHFKAVGFDACIMASLEVMEVLGNSTPTFLGSQEVEPKDGWHYAHILPQADKIPDFINAMAMRYVEQESDKPLCLSLVRTEKIPSLIKGLNSLSEGLSQMFEACKEVWDEIPRIANGEYVDLYTLLERTEANIVPFSQKAGELKNMLEQQIVERNYTNCSDYRGVSLWLPKSVRSYKMEKYSQLPLASSCPAYLDLLQRYVTIN
jgi:hypothetical protein